jgi:hypothetical protein
MNKRDFTQYVHEWTRGRDGKRMFAVARWDQERAQFIRPLDATQASLTGCFAEFGRIPGHMQSYPSRRQALRRARYLFYEMDKEFLDAVAEFEEGFANEKG